MPQDILVNEGGELLMPNGDFVIGNSTDQHQVHLFIAHKGEYKQSPQVGIGADDYLNDDNIADMAGEIQKQFEADGMKVKKVEVFEEGKVKWDANYNY